MAQDDWLMGSIAAQDTYNPVEGAFQAGIRATPWYDEFTQRFGGAPNLNDPDYDYRAAWTAGARPEVRDPGDQLLHWPSAYKSDTHPDRFINGVDTRPWRPEGPLANAFDVPGEQSTNVGWANRMGEILTARPPDNPAVAYKTPYFDITEGDIGRATEAAMGVSGGGLSTGLINPRARIGGNQPSIKAYHSSPHDFDKFDLAKIGTGEGAQVYGHGLYFAENPAVSGKGGTYWQQFSGRFHGPEREALDDLFRHGMDPEKALAATQRNIADKQALLEGRGLSIMDRARYADQLAKSEAKASYLASDKPFGPRTYEVNIKADPAHMLDWDKPLAEMSPRVKDALRDTWMAHPEGHSQQTGSQIYKINERQMATGGRGLAYKLNEAGIPGIKYLDQGSRISSPTQIDLIRQNIAHREALLAERPGDPTNTKWLAEYQDMLRRAENPTSNYVIFDPGIIDIMKKYGIAGAAPTAMGALAAQDQYRE